MFGISELEKVGSYLGSLATESHLGVIYSIMPGDFQTPFAINPATGVLVLEKALDYEVTPSYNLTVIATSMVMLGQY